ISGVSQSPSVQVGSHRSGLVGRGALGTPKTPLCSSRSTGLLPTSTIRLDRENISSIGKLRRLAEIHSLYLQQVRSCGSSPAPEGATDTPSSAPVCPPRDPEGNSFPPSPRVLSQ
uniref:Uncharacterized protein n=1 Tax=Corvus moneduloides TaxID=1196302 RepID=A0A8U7NRM7_CORMO